MCNPMDGAASLLAWTAVVLIANGLLRLARLLSARSEGQVLVLFAGLIALLLGLAVWIRWPIADLWIVGLCIAVDYICHGLSWVLIALAEHKPLEGANPSGVLPAQKLS